MQRSTRFLIIENYLIKGINKSSMVDFTHHIHLGYDFAIPSSILYPVVSNPKAAMKFVGSYAFFGLSSKDVGMAGIPKNSQPTENRRLGKIWRSTTMQRERLTLTACLPEWSSLVRRFGTSPHPYSSEYFRNTLLTSSPKRRTQALKKSDRPLSLSHAM